MASVYARPSGSPADTVVFRQLKRSPHFDVVRSGGKAYARRVSRLPARGLLRVLIPRTKVWLRGDERWTVRPDGLAVFFVIAALGGVVIELTQDRVSMPRDYPPAFIYGFAIGYIGLLILDIVITRRAVGRALAAAPG